MKHIGLLILIGLLVTVTTTAIASAYSNGNTAPRSPITWYKDVVTVYSPQGTNNAFDYTELSERIRDIEPVERKKSLDLSQERIDSMTTTELLVTCLDYPLFGDIFFYDNVTSGFNTIAKRYNGLQALLERDDVGDVLVEFYSAVDLENVLATDDLGALRMTYLEMIIASDQVLDSMSLKTRHKLYDKCVSNYKEINEKFSSKLNPAASARIAGKILYIDSPDFKELADKTDSVLDFLNGYGFVEYSEETLTQVEDCVKKFEIEG